MRVSFEVSDWPDLECPAYGLTFEKIDRSSGKMTHDSFAL